MISWPTNRRNQTAWGAVAVAGCLAAGAQSLERWRLPSPDRLASNVFRVTSAAGDGPGSLRAAFLAADRAAGRARIVVAVPKITLDAVLPPLVNPDGVIVEAAQPGAELDGTRLVGPVLDVASPGTVVSGFRIAGGRVAIVVRAAGVTLRNLRILEQETGVLADGSGSLRIADSAFVRNRVGVYIAEPRGLTTFQNARFEDHGVAAIRAVNTITATAAAAQIDVVDSRFHNDAIGLVAVNVIARLEGNRFDGQGSSAVRATGGRVVISGNRILAGRGFGIHAERLQSGSISGNEIARNCNGGILLRDVGDTQVIGNDLYQNSYGVGLMEGPPVTPNMVANNLIADHIGDGLRLIGSSPMVSRNRLLRNREAAVRLSSFRLDSGATRIPTPLLSGNVVRENGRDEPQHDHYAGETSTTASSAGDCTWRLGVSPIYAVQRVGDR